MRHAPSSTRRTFASLRRHRNYRLYFAGQVVSLSGTWMQNIALAWLVVELTHSPVAVGLLAFCRFVPFTVFGLFAGVARRPPRQPPLDDAHPGGLDGGLGRAWPRSARWDGHPLLAVYVLAALGGTPRSSTRPAGTRSRSSWSGATSSRTPSRSTPASSTPPACRTRHRRRRDRAGGIGWCFAVNAVSFLAVLAALAADAHARALPARPARAAGELVAAIRAGLGYVAADARDPARPAMTMVVTTVGFNFHVLVPVLASKTLHVGRGGLRRTRRRLRSRRARRCAACRDLRQGELEGPRPRLGRLQHDAARARARDSVWPVAVLLFLTGVCFTTWTANSQSIVQLTAPDHLRGRVLVDLPLRLRRLRAGRRAARRLAAGRGRDGARLPGRGHRLHGDDGYTPSRGRVRTSRSSPASRARSASRPDVSAAGRAPRTGRSGGGVAPNGRAARTRLTQSLGVPPARLLKAHSPVEGVGVRALARCRQEEAGAPARAGLSLDGIHERLADPALAVALRRRRARSASPTDCRIRPRG